ncbi:MAG TPA: VCBS repeat-containing protein [Myxococcota bacterium]|nr:VCBS repeat-containing protein [Myxococcota bacterium]
MSHPPASPRLTRSSLAWACAALCLAACSTDPLGPSAGGVSTIPNSRGNGVVPQAVAFKLAGTFRTTLSGSAWSNADVSPRWLADFDGDGLSDLMAMDAFNLYFSKNTGTTFATPLLLRDDFTAGGGWTSQDASPRLFGDVTGDGLADLVAIGGASTFVNVSKGTDTVGSLTYQQTTFTANDGFPLQATTPRFVADVDGDGKADLVGIDAAGVHVSLSDGNRFAPRALWSDQFTAARGYTSQRTQPRLMADVDGDGKADLVGFGEKGITVGFSSGQGFEVKVVSTELSGAGWPNQDATPRFAGDVDGDGKADFVGIDANGVHVVIGAGRLPAQASYVAYGGFNGADGFISQVATPRYVIDVNGDDKADLVGFPAAGLVVLLAP